MPLYVTTTRAQVGPTTSAQVASAVDTWTAAEFQPFIPSRLIGSGVSEQIVNGRITLVGGNLRIFRAQDVSAEGVITGRPYYGIRADDTTPEDHFGPVVTTDWSGNRYSFSVQVYSVSRAGATTYNVTPRTNVSYLFGRTNILFGLITQARKGRLRFDGTRYNPRTRTNPEPGGYTFTDRYFTGRPCNGSWIYVLDETWAYSTIDANGVTRNYSFSTTRRASYTAPVTMPCPGDPPSAPTVRVTGITSSTAEVSWTIPANSLLPTRWEVSTDNATWTRVAFDSNSPRAESYTLTGLAPNTSHTVYVRGVAARGAGPTGQHTFRTLAGGPLPMTVTTPTVSSSNVGEVSATINWVAGTGGLAVAKWQWSTDNSTWTDVPGGAVPTSLDVDNLVPDTAYTYYIRGVSSGGVNSDAGSTTFTTASLPIAPDEPVVAGEVQRSLVGTPGGGSLKTTDRPPAFVVRSNRPSVVWDTSPFVVAPTNIYPGATLPGTEDNRGYADEFDPLPLKWSFFPAPASSAAQASVRVLLNVYDTAGNSIDAGQRTLQLVNNVASFTATATRVASELSQFDVAGNVAGTQAASQGAPNGWGATPAGDSVGFARIGLQLSALDNASPAVSSNTALMEFVPYQGLRLGDISTYNAGAGLVGFECHYYAKGITATTQARNNDVAYYKWAIYRRNAPENERPVAGTIREAGQTLTASGAHWVPTGWSMGYRQHAWQTSRGQVALVRTGLRNPDTTRLRIAFPSAETTGLLPNGNYTIRLRVIDIYGNQVGPVSYNFNVSRAGGTTTPVSTTLPPGSDAQTIAVVPVPRVYTADGTLTTTANTGLADVYDRACSGAVHRVVGECGRDGAVQGRFAGCGRFGRRGGEYPGYPAA